MTPQDRMDDEGETTKRMKGDTEAHEARRETITKATTGTKGGAGVARAGLPGGDSLG